MLPDVVSLGSEHDIRMSFVGCSAASKVLLVEVLELAEVLVGTFDVDPKLIKVIVLPPKLQYFVGVVNKVLTNHVLFWDEPSINL